MKKLLIISLVFLAGCSFLGKQYDYTKLCASDPKCLAEAKSDSALVGTVAGAFYPPVAGAASGAALILALWYRGKKKKEDQ